MRSISPPNRQQTLSTSRSNRRETQYEQQRIEAQWEIFRNQSQANELLASSLDGLQNSTSSALTGL
jgi:hypothetical protein